MNTTIQQLIGMEERIHSGGIIKQVMLEKDTAVQVLLTTINGTILMQQLLQGH